MKIYHSLLILFSFILVSCNTPEEPEPAFDPTKNYLYGKDITGTMLGGVVLQTDESIWNIDGATNPGQQLNTIKKLEGGGKHVLALKIDGTVLAWGYNELGQLGDGTDTAMVTASVQVKDLNGVIAISAGAGHSLALRIDGSVWAWGDNTYGQLGDSTKDTKNYPVKVKNLSDVIAISAGGQHSVAVKSDGTVWGWGRYTFGNLGTGSSADEIAAVPINGLSNVKMVAAGTWFTLALKNDGTVWGLGYNALGQLANGVANTSFNSTPQQALVLNDAVTIDASNSYAMALRSDSTVWAWGDNYYGNLGDGTHTARSIPVKALYLEKVKNISCRWHNTSLAIDKDNIVWRWGLKGLINHQSTPDRVEIP